MRRKPSGRIWIEDPTIAEARSFFDAIERLGTTKVEVDDDLMKTYSLKRLIDSCRLDYATEEDLDQPCGIRDAQSAQVFAVSLLAWENGVLTLAVDDMQVLGYYGDE